MDNTTKRPKRQNVRRVVGTFLFLSFPTTFYYFSPYLSIMGAIEGVVAGSVLLFAFLFISSLVVGRLFCAWACSAGAMMEVLAQGRGKAAPPGRVRWVKYLVWAPWAIALLALLARGADSLRVAPLYSTEMGFSVSSVGSHITYLGVALIFLVISLAVGKRGACHTVCWMAPFMILGRKLANALRLPALRLRMDRSSCTSCKTCDRACPMSLAVSEHVRRQRPEHTDCILCGACVDACARGCIRYGFGAPREPGPAA